MNHSCAGIGVAANVTQWTPEGSTQEEKNAIVCTFVRQFWPISRNLSTRRKNNALHTKMLKRNKKLSTGLEPRLSGPHEQISFFGFWFILAFVLALST